ncbi:CarboxypepD_reg-like domain-containing protein [Lutibacter agarilyticus]|uniref:CarboxypepD_reg-like domain-containing protein n=1 Tax=Lutibacter agarilyticus TaxID=1109740 RepID=A0A238XPG0_9FLAO|nr:carboxypeptidase-like regulatory domain-containing protein [Lutibacter agarilyticus]SNR60333.1 CarboxypepD_reg-like domain-containing protein [Lutibacter agarilyticus]
MKKILVIIYLVLNSTISNSQERDIKGVITDSLKNPIQYVNVGILNKPVGTVTNENGEFFLNINNSFISDTLKISCLGYKSKELQIEKLSNNESAIISLENHTEILNEIIIKSSNLKTYSKGKEKTKTKNKVFFAIPSLKNLNLGSEIGRKFSLGTKKPSLLKEFKFFLKENNFDSVLFRINFYKIENNKPSKKINSRNILIPAENQFTGWISVDLTDYEIKTQEDIIVAVEWIKASEKGDKLSLPILVPSFSSTHYYKYGTHAKWKKYGSISTAMILTYKQ